MLSFIPSLSTAHAAFAGFCVNCEPPWSELPGVDGGETLCAPQSHMKEPIEWFFVIAFGGWIAGVLDPPWLTSSSSSPAANALPP